MTHAERAPDHDADVVRALSPRLFWTMLGAIVALAACVYWPGLRGVFLFDDFANLPALGAYGPVDNATAFWRYLTSGDADPTGRPLALLSFLLDAHDWPADPYPFKRTNLILHLLNGVLLALLLRRLGRVLDAGSTRRSEFAALLGAALWLLHPFLISTTLYIVQREAMLPCTFTLLGLIGYVAARERAARGARFAALGAGAAIVFCTLLAGLSKANGFLLPSLIWLADALLLAPRLPLETARVRRDFALLRHVLLIAPTALLVAGLAYTGVDLALHGVPSFRAWTLGERLLTEARVVCDYLGSLWLPRPYSRGVFNDSFALSHGWLDPPTTLGAVALLALLIGGAIRWRKALPAAAFALLFYCLAQILESSVIPLELYYEHRNYLPALFMFWPLAWWLCGEAPQQRTLRRGLALALPLLFATLTFFGAELWGDAANQAEVWARKNPDSPRAQAYAAQVERARGRADLAVARLRAARVVPGDDLQIALNLLGAECELGGVAAADVTRTEQALRGTRTPGQLGYDWFAHAFTELANGHSCPGLDAATFQRLLDAAAQNTFASKILERRQDDLSLRGTLELAQHQPDAALKYFNAAYDLKPRSAVALEQAAQLGRAGSAALGLEHLAHVQERGGEAAVSGWSMQRLHDALLRHEGYWQGEFEHLRAALREDAAQAAAQGEPAS